MLLCDKVFDIDKTLHEIDEVTVDDVNKMAEFLFTQRPALAYVGTDCKINFEEYLRR